MERAVLDQLADYFKTRLSGYPTTLAEDESMVLVVQNRSWLYHNIGKFYGTHLFFFP